MEQRIYHGPVTPDGLADYLVAAFNQTRDTAAQRVATGERVLVQIGHSRHKGWRGMRHALGVSIMRTADGVDVSMGQSNWLDLADSSMAGLLIGAVFFPPLLIFPVLRGIRVYDLYQDIWNAVDAYCMQAGATQGNVNVAHGVHCPRCGVLNHEDARFCTTCGMELEQQPEEEEPVGVAQETVVCAECHHTVTATRFCGNCGARLGGGVRSS